MRKAYVVLACLTLLAWKVNCQDDPLPFCVSNPDNSNAPTLPQYVTTTNDLNMKFQAHIERMNKGKVEEFTEIYDAVDNVGIVRSSLHGFTYSYYDTNELFTIQDDKCKVLILDENYGSTQFIVASFNRNLKIASPLNLLLATNLKNITYIGTNSVRGIPVNQWQMCFENPVVRTTTKFTLSFSDAKRWDVKSELEDYDTVPVEILIETLNADGTIFEDRFSITRFRTLLPDDLETLLTPRGIYCPNRKSTKPFPVLASSFQYKVQIIAINDDQSQVGQVQYATQLFDNDLKLSKSFKGIGSQKNAEIHDYNTGLIYMMEGEQQKCTVISKKVNEVPELKELSFSGLNTIFDNQNTSYQYTGQRFANGIKAETWIGERMWNNRKSVFEWFFLAQDWRRLDMDIPLATPIKLNTYTTIEVPSMDDKTKIGTVNIQASYSFFDYRPGAYLNLHDLSRCDNTAGKKKFLFTVSGEYKDFLRNNQQQFDKGVIRKMATLARVTPIRVSRTEIVIGEYNVFVYFTLFERSRYYGESVSIPSDDVSLDEAFKNLMNEFGRDKVPIEFMSDFSAYDPSMKNKLALSQIPANKDSLVEVGEDEYGAYMTIDQLIYETGQSGLGVFVVSVMMLLIGFLVSTLIVVVIKVKNIKIPYIIQ